MTTTATARDRASEASEEAAVNPFSLPFDQVREGMSYESAPREVGALDVDVFAALTGDRHPVHTDLAWAERSPFGGRIAHGMLVLSCAVGSLPLDPERVLALRRIRDAVFKRPLAVGESIRVDCRVIGARPLDERTGLVDCEWRIAGEDGRLRARALVEVLWSRGIDAASVREPVAAEREPAPTATGSPGASDRDELAPVEVRADQTRVLL